MAGLVRSTTSKKHGKHFWEFTINTGAASCILGVVTEDANLEDYPGADIYGWGYCGFGTFKHNGKSIGTGWAVAKNGDTIGFALDATNGTLQCYKNGLKMGPLITDITTPIFAAAGGMRGSSSTANFGASPFKGNVPKGYNHGLYDTNDSFEIEREKYSKLSITKLIILFLKGIFTNKKS